MQSLFVYRLMLVLVFAVFQLQAQASLQCLELFGDDQVALKPSSVEVTLSESLKGRVDPQAIERFRSAIYGKNRTALNAFLVALINCWPTSAFLDLLVEKLKDASLSDLADLSRTLLKQTLISKISMDSVLSLRTVEYSNFLAWTAALKEYKQTLKARLYRGGRIELASIYDERKNETHYYRLNAELQVAEAISQSQFDLEMALPPEDFSQPLKHSLFTWTSDTASSDENMRLLSNVERSLAPNVRDSFRYAVNSLSSEGLSALFIYLRNGHPELASLLAQGLQSFQSGIWQFVKKQGYSPTFTAAEYSESEFAVLKKVFTPSLLEYAGRGYRLIVFSSGNRQFTSARNANGSLIFRKITAAKRQDLMDQLRMSKRPYWQISIRQDANLLNMPETPYEIPVRFLDNLNFYILNPWYATFTGWKLPAEKVENLIAADRKTIGKAKVPAKTIADFLIFFMRAADAGKTNIEWQGHRFEIVSEQREAFWESPFDERLRWQKSYLIWNLQTGEQIRFNAGQPYLIGFYGFFGGGTSLRLDPLNLIRFMKSALN